MSPKVQKWQPATKFEKLLSTLLPFKESLLLTNEHLDKAKKYLDDYPEKLGKDDKIYIKESIDFRKTFIFSIGMISVLIIALGITIYQHQDNSNQREIADSRCSS